MGALSYLIISARMLERVMALDSGSEVRLVEDYGKHCGLLPMSLPRTLLPYLPMDPGAVLHPAGDFASLAASGLWTYSHGNGYPADHTVLETSYQAGSEYLATIIGALPVICPDLPAADGP